MYSQELYKKRVGLPFFLHMIFFHAIFLFFGTHLFANRTHIVLSINQAPKSISSTITSGADFGFDGFSEEKSRAAISSAESPESSNSEQELLVYPSPAPNFRAEAGFRAPDGPASDMTLKCFDMNGKTLFSHTFTPTTGYNKIQLQDLLSYQPGSGAYMLALYNQSLEILDKTWFGVITE